MTFIASPYEYIKLNKIKVLSLLVLLVVFIIGVILRMDALKIATTEWHNFGEFVPRDFDRAFNIIDNNYIPLAGPELTNGGRSPGPFLYFLLSVPLLFHYSYESIFIFNFI